MATTTTRASSTLLPAAVNASVLVHPKTLYSWLAEQLQKCGDGGARGGAGARDGNEVAGEGLLQLEPVDRGWP